MGKSKKPKLRKGTTLSRKEKDKIIVYVIKKLFPRFAGLLMSAVIDVMHPTDDQLVDIIDTTNRYAEHVSEGRIDIDDIKKNIERKTGRKLEDLMKWSGRQDG